MVTRRHMQYARESGLGDLLQRCTFGAWKTGGEEWREKLLESATQYAKAPEGWFLVSGSPGTGKTHICTAIARRLIGDGVPVRYMVWRSVVPQLNACIQDAERYAALMDPLKRVRVLYIDDFLKTDGTGQTRRRPPGGEINRALELINERAMDRRMITMISTEWTVEELIDLDAALGSRIYEKAKEHCFNLTGKENWRLRDKC